MTTVVDLCAPLGADRRPRFHRSVVALGTADISLKILGSCHACLLVCVLPIPLGEDLR